MKNKDMELILLAAIVAYVIVLGLGSCKAQAGVDIATGVLYQQTLGEYDNAPLLKLTITEEGKPYYLFAAYEQGTSRLLGQPLADTSIVSAGVGYRTHLSSNVFLFGELGYAYLDHSINEIIKQEIVYTDLVDRHNKINRPIPIGKIQDRLLSPMGPYDQSTYETVWETKGGITGAIGVGWTYKHLEFITSYRPLIVKEHLELYDPKIRADGGGWWQESRNRDYSTIQLGVQWRF